MPSEHKYALPAGARLRQYRIVRLLGHGGFGLTYLAEDTKLNRKVAIKELLPMDFAIRKADGITVVARSEQDKAHFQWARQRFVEEGRTLANLHHPSILPIYEIFEEHGTACLVTAFIDGENLEEWLGKVRRPAEKDLRFIAVSLLDALEMVHERGYLHRDVKPDNILMDRRNRRPILIDFGNARVASGAKTANLTAVLSKGYAPFEQYQTKGRQGPCTDIYALGAVLYRAIKGVAPEDSADRLEQDKVEPLSRRPPPGYSREFLTTVDKAMQMRRENRWQTCGEWKAALGASDRSEPDPRPLPKPSRTVLAATALGLLTVAGVGIGFWINHLQEDDRNPPASNPATAEIKVTPGNATADHPFVDSLGQEFVPVPGTNVLFCRWDTRSSDWQAFIQEEGDTEQGGIYGLDDNEIKWSPRKELSWKNPGFEQTSRDPVVGISWEDARRFCAWLSKKEGRTYRLPTDAEWSTAAGTQKYPWGNEFPPPMGAGNYCGSESRLKTGASATTAWTTIDGYNDRFPRTSPVGSFAANQYGLYDMGGNVWQWCEDQYRASMNSAEAQEKIPALKAEKAVDGTPYFVIRGGSWANNDEMMMRSSYRAANPPTVRKDIIGFRCVLARSGGLEPVKSTIPGAPRTSPFSRPAGPSPKAATKDAPFVNSLGQEFVPVPGTKVLFCRWDTRLSDWQAFIRMEGDTEQWGIFVVDDKEIKWTINKNLSWMNPGFAQTSRHPVVGVSWQDAHRFCAWLSKKEGRTYRLPSDAEWSAAVGPWKYPWGGEFPPPAGAGNYSGSESRLSADASGTNAWSTIPGYNDGFARTSPTGSFAPNEYGLYDMGGNVWQWCEDEYKTSMNSAAALEKYPNLKKEKDDDGTNFRVLRGASWYDDSSMALESKYHARGYPTSRAGDDGFRCVLVISGD